MSDPNPNKNPSKIYTKVNQNFHHMSMSILVRFLIRTWTKNRFKIDSKTRSLKRMEKDQSYKPVRDGTGSALGDWGNGGAYMYMYMYRYAYMYMYLCVAARGVGVSAGGGVWCLSLIHI